VSLERGEDSKRGYFGVMSKHATKFGLDCFCEARRPFTTRIAATSDPPLSPDRER